MSNESSTIEVPFLAWTYPDNQPYNKRSSPCSSKGLFTCPNNTFRLSVLLPTCSLAMRIQSLLEYGRPQEKKDGSTPPKSKMIYISFLMVFLFLFYKCNSIPPNITYSYQKKAAVIHHSLKRLKHYKRKQ